MRLAELARGQLQWQPDEARIYTHPLDIQLLSDRLIFQLMGDITGRSIVDIGCGTGILSRQFAIQGARRVIGVDTSNAMIEQAVAQKGNLEGLDFYQVASADALPFRGGVFDSAISSLTVNNFPNPEMTKDSFQEAARVLCEDGVYIVSLPHPLTLSFGTKFRQTEFQAGQRQNNLIPGEGFIRKIMGKDENMITITNYYWPPDVLVNFAARAGFVHTHTIQPVVTAQEMDQYGDILESIHRKVPFFLVMAFLKNSK